MGQSREKLLGLAGWMSGNLVLGVGRLFEAGRLLTFSTFRVGASLRPWALIRGWALNRINTVCPSHFYLYQEPFRIESLPLLEMNIS